MPSLTTCLKKAGDLLHPEDKLAITTRARALQKEGLSSTEAARQAVSEQHENVAKPVETKAAKQEPSAVQTLAEKYPDLKVKLPGSDETLTVSDALAKANEEAVHEAGFAKLVEAAMNCALGG